MNQVGPIQKRLEKIMEMVNRSPMTSIGSVLTGIIGVINNPESSARDLVELVQIDPPLAAKVLATANSVLYAPRRRIAEIGQAVIYIGFEALKEIALRQKVCRLFGEGGPVNGFSRPGLWRHSVAVAMCAKMIYRREFQQRGENAYAAGLLHDIGIIVEDQLLHDVFHQIVMMSQRQSKVLTICEQAVLGFDHARIGAAVAGQWNLPEEIIVAIGCHHCPWQYTPAHRQIVATLHVADYSCAVRGIGFNIPEKDEKNAFHRSLDALDLSIDAVDLIMDDVQTQIRDMEEQGLL
jgi:putative nucleotidyltransferase with HDIG domain